MPTQIAPTPIIMGKEAITVYREANRETSEKAKRGAQQLALKYDKLLKLNEDEE